MNKHYIYPFSSVLLLALLIAANVGFINYFTTQLIDWKLILSIFVLTIIFNYSITYYEMTKLKARIEKLYHIVFNKTYDKDLNFIDYLDQLIAKIEKDATSIEEEIDLLTERENFRKDFLGDISHELKTPLFSIQGYALTLIEGGVDDIDIRDRYLDRINKSTERLIYIIKDLDLLAELEDSRFKIEVKPFNLTATVQEVFDLLEMKATKNNAHLIMDKSYDGIKVLGDLDKIRQVVINLIVNAMKHSHKTGVTICISMKIEERSVQLSISDDGQGISAEHLPRIFERFYRVDKSRSRSSGGSGLGLSIAKHIIEAHGQKIYAQSQPDIKTTFYFSLPKAK